MNFLDYLSQAAEHVKAFHSKSLFLLVFHGFFVVLQLLK